MKIQIERIEFLKRLKVVEKTITENKIKPIISCAYIETRGDNLFFCGTNLETTITTEMKCKEVIESGKIVFQHQLVEEYLKELKDIVSENCLLTDVGSVKEPIQTAIKELDMETNFIGGHPMVGSEKSGYAYANDHLLENAYYFLTPSERTLFQLTTKFSSFIQGLGALAVSLKPEEHDFITAAISHVPHIVAAELVHLVRRADRNNGMLKQLAAGGFKDITRIASSSPVMWEQICENNSSNIRTLLTSMIHDLQEVIDQLDNKNGTYVNEYFKEAGEYRNSVPDHSIGLFDKVHKLYVHIPDQPGTIATVASLLAFNSISLKNIGIIYNREFEEGVLEIVLYDEESCQKGAQVLEERNYIVHIR